VEAPLIENAHGKLAELADFGSVQFSNCQAVDQSGDLWDMMVQKLPAHWTASEVEMEPAKTIIAAPSVNPLVVTRMPLGVQSAGWPTSARDGPWALYVLMGGSGLSSDWVSCAGNYCIAGDGPDIDVYELSPLQYLGYVSATSAPNPFAVLTKVGFTAAQANQLLSG
jgi:hypothetical protein